jgi:hypothetical protein
MEGDVSALEHREASVPVRDGEAAEPMVAPGKMNQGLATLGDVHSRHFGRLRFVRTAAEKGPGGEKEHGESAGFHGTAIVSRACFASQKSRVCHRLAKEAPRSISP